MRRNRRNPTPIDPKMAEALRAAVKAVGGQSAMGRLIGVDQSTVHDWIKLGKALPAEYVLTVEGATCISRHVLRHDLHPLEDTPTSGGNPELQGFAA